MLETSHNNVFETSSTITKKHFFIKEVTSEKRKCEGNERFNVINFTHMLNFTLK